MSQNPPMNTSQNLISDRFRHVCIHFPGMGFSSCRAKMNVGPQVFPMCCFFADPACRHYRPPSNDAECAMVGQVLIRGAAEVKVLQETNACPRCQHQPLDDRRVKGGPHNGTGQISCPQCGWVTVINTPTLTEQQQSSIKSVTQPAPPPA